jgi:hypothetical protein
MQVGQTAVIVGGHVTEDCLQNLQCVPMRDENNLLAIALAFNVLEELN